MPSRRTITDLPPTRFAAGWRFVEPRTDGFHAPPPRPGADITVDIVRPHDLLAITASFNGCTLVAREGETALVACNADAAGTLTADYSYQHAHEYALYEQPASRPGHQGTSAREPVPVVSPIQNPYVQIPVVDGAHPPDPAGAELPIPVGYRPARATRLVFEIPAGTEIEFTTAGILGAISRLHPVLHGLGKPGGDVPAPYTPPSGLRLHGPIIPIGGGVIATLTANGSIIENATAAQLKKLGTLGTATITGTVFTAARMRAVREQLAQSTPIVDRKVKRGRVNGGLIDLIPGSFGPIRRRGTYSDTPAPGQTAIEAPFRLILSPTEEARWAHAVEPVVAADAPAHVELWHSRLSVATGENPTRPDADPDTPDEKNSARRIVRAIWTRDRDALTTEQWRDPKADQAPGVLGTPDPGQDDPFRGSLNRADRHRIVRQTSETWPGTGRTTIPPVPIGVKGLWLSSLGAWLDLHGSWATKPYSLASIASVQAWDHIAPMGRDQFVRVVYPGYLYPFGNQTAIVKITERKMKSASPSIAGLYQRKFLVIGEPVRLFDDEHNFPFSRVELRPHVTPTIDDPGSAQDRSFWPTIANVDFAFVVDALDRDLKRVVFQTPLLWVAEHMVGAIDRRKVDTDYAAHPNRVIDLHGQKVAFAQKAPGGDAVVETTRVRLLGTAKIGESIPRLSSADVVIPAVQQLSATPSITIAYNQIYRQKGFGGAQNSGMLWADVVLDAARQEHSTDPTVSLPKMEFGTPAKTSATGGGFVSPSLPIRGLSALSGAVGDTVGMATQKFDPAAFLQDALPRLFGLVNLIELVEAVTGEPLKVPSVVSETLDRIGQLLADLQRAKEAAEEAVEEAQRMVDNAADTAAGYLADAEAVKTTAENVLAELGTLVDQLPAIVSGLIGKAEAEVADVFDDPIAGIRPKLQAAINQLTALGPKLPPLVRNRIASITGVLKTVLAATDLITDIWRFVNNFDPSSVEVSFRYAWKPEMKSWPVQDPKKVILEFARPDCFVLAIEGRASGKGEMGVTVLAELRDFTLHLLPGAPLIVLPFEHMSFKSGSSGKTEVDVLLGEMKFVGLLSFVEVIKDLIPFDGFSDPPFLDVSPAGVNAGFTLTLPSVAIGVFSLTNMSLGADVQVPFLGKSVTVGFNFCSRERPFTLAVVFLGGGGWFGLRLSPDGLDILELGLEAGACLSVDFGVASGSISAMIGIYIRLEGDKGSLTGYFRLRGEVDVLGLISASIELYMELTYQFDTGKMVGRATITVQVKVFLFSASVKISAERQFAGSNGDPSFRQVMVAADGSAPDWSDYCVAFAPEGA